MATTNNEKIDAFLSGDLTGADKAAFDRQLEAETSLSREVSFWHELDEVLEDESTLEFQRQVAKAGNVFLGKEEDPAAKVRSIGSTRRYFAIAATVLLLVTAGLFIINNPFATDFSGKDLYATNFETYDLDASRNRGTAINTPTIDFETGVKQYKAGDFSTASTTFEALLANDKDNMAVIFALSQAKMNLNPPDLTSAGNLLQQVITDGNSAYVLSAQWYLALVKLQQEKPKEAKPLLEIVQQSGGEKLRDKATAILSTLE